jgi:hypothetical protein
MSRVLLGLTCTGLLLSFAVGHAQSDRDLFPLGKQAWERQDYQAAFGSLREFRERPYGRTLEVDYMLGTSACRISQQRTWGANVLQWISYAYELTPQGQAKIERELQLCRAEDTASPAPPSPDAGRMVTAGVFSRGKSFHWLDQKTAVTSYAPSHIREVTSSELSARLIRTNDKQGALRLASPISPRSKTFFSEHFLIVSESDHSSSQLRAASENFESFLSFLQNEYGLSPPLYFITIYLTPSLERMQRLARDLHGLRLDRATIGYSSLDDLSVLAVTPRTIYGTVLHELTHLLVRSNFGDIPPWLDEGLASLYESVIRKNGAYRGVPNWRGPILGLFETNYEDADDLRRVVPSVARLVTTRWSSLYSAELLDVNDYGAAAEKQALSQAAFFATARYFMLYLQYLGKLSEVYKAVSSYSASAEFNGSPDDVLKIIERILQQPVMVIETDFKEWLQVNGIIDEDNPRFVRDSRSNWVGRDWPLKRRATPSTGNSPR